MIQAFFVGWIIGFAIAIPPGALSLTVFTYAIERGSRAAALIAIGGMVFEIIYALFGFLGIRFAEDLQFGTALRILSCVVILFLGFKHTFGEIKLELKPVESTIKDKRSLMLLGLFLTGSAPTIAAAYLALAGVVHSMNYFPASFENNLIAAFAAGAGSMSWILCTLFFIRQTRETLNPSIIHSIARGSGILLLGIGVYYAIDLIRNTGGA